MTVSLLLPCPCSINNHRSRVSDLRRIVVIRSRLIPTNVSACTMRRSEAEWKPNILYLDAESDWTVISQTLDGSYLFGINQWPSAEMVPFDFRLGFAAYWLYCSEKLWIYLQPGKVCLTYTRLCVDSGAFPWLVNRSPCSYSSTYNLHSRGLNY